MPAIVDKIQKESSELLANLVVQTLSHVERKVVDPIGDFKSLSQQSDAVIDRFIKNIGYSFDDLMDRESNKDDAVFSFENLSLVQEEELEVIVALEGMVNAARNKHLAVFISFNARLSSLFPKKRIDESSNPLDPEQIATAFQEAIRPLSLDAKNTLTVYRAFNAEVLKNLDQVLNLANRLLTDNNVLPDLGIEGQSRFQPPSRSRSNRRTADASSPFDTIEEEVIGENEDRPELFSIMQNLLRSEEPAKPGAAPASADGGVVDIVGEGLVEASQAVTSTEGEMIDLSQIMVPAAMVPAPDSEADPQARAASGPAPAMLPFQPQQGQTVQVVDQVRLMDVLTSIQEKLSSTPALSIPGTIEEVDKLDISQSLGEVLQSSQEDKNVISAIDRQSSDIINLVTLLYEAIWDDSSVPIPIKELIGRTQITIIKVALADVEFFNNENHPARAILNEFAAAGIGWTEVERLEEDPLYKKIRELVERILANYTNNNELFDELLADFHQFKAQEAARTRKLEQRILKASERKERLEDIHELVGEKIEERTLGRELEPFVEELLKGPFYKFMVLLVLKEGPGSNAWKQAINTIDVLLWTVQPHEHTGDKDRLATVNPRLLNNLRKAFRIASVDKTEIDQLIAQLQRVQDDTFPGEVLEEPEQGNDASNDTAEATEEGGIGEEQPIANSGVRFLAAGEFEQETSREAEASEAEALLTETQADKAGRETAEPEQAEAASGDAAGDDKLADDDSYMRRVDALGVGMWVEFIGQNGNNTRCRLAAKINAIDKYIFVNRQGVKVVEKTRLGLALELRDGTVSIVSDGLLFSRALEAVIGNLRDSQHEQQTGSAYQPVEGESPDGSSQTA